ncbi:uncharacterized protein LOC120266426 [Dioscorea cayenensis subsp. rotundata]|uniref:Uncharacterized protein LOC120266426 n=1 Tax=Dioscorea cayennensis subsp. rotundata TaxID=55577 RepID=A0AB40BR88_DIOCR|nr:uncharacterized protein LOC120266426 [Dioscorea cayenensis subsp. rotundata]
MAEGEISVLKDALFNQCVLLEKLYNEIEEERDASASAANEALSMILRLQREKAIEKMEACQYKRMIEEKLYLAEELLADLEEVVQQKEMEIQTLKSQLKACKHQSTSVIDVKEMRILGKPSTLWKKKCLFRRNISLPVLRFDCLCHEPDIIDETSPSLLTRQLISGEDGDYRVKLERKFTEGENSELFEDSNTDLKHSEEETRTWNKNVEEGCCNGSLVIKDPVNVEEVSPACSWYSAVSGEGVRIKLNGEHVSRLPSQSENSQKLSDCGSPSSSCLETESNVTTFHSVSVQDIYEVPEDQKGDKLNENFNQVLEDSILKAKEILMPHEAMNYILKDDEWLNKALIYSHQENKVSKLRKGTSMNHGKRFLMPMRTKSMNYHVVDPPKNEITEYLKNVGQLKCQLQQFERENATIQGGADRGKEQLKLLKEIYKQLNVIESKIRNPHVKKHAQEEDSKLVSVMEAVLSFSI